mmetsp:Transcript_6370/g.16617  ORF Transcript_6370/g.16617 Transcript_6370/m.16617 type:complete len:375 (-) Transcript_6370:775-1899(-)
MFPFSFALEAHGEEVLELEVAAVEDVNLGSVEEGRDAVHGGGSAEGLKDVGEDVDDALLDEEEGHGDAGDGGVGEDARAEDVEAVHDGVVGFGLGPGAPEAVPAGPHGKEPVLEPGDGRRDEPGSGRFAADHPSQRRGEGGPVDEGREVRREDVEVVLGLGLGGGLDLDVVGEAALAGEEERVEARAEFRSLGNATLVGPRPADEGELVVEARGPAVLVPRPRTGAELAVFRVRLEPVKVVGVARAADDGIKVLGQFDGFGQSIARHGIEDRLLELGRLAGEFRRRRDDDPELAPARHVGDPGILRRPGGLVGLEVDVPRDSVVAGAGLRVAAEVVDAGTHVLHVLHEAPAELANRRVEPHRQGIHGPRRRRRF